ncbi:MAG: hypothetical protein KAI17_05195 [Thiotrichaceae bacterium]|nr:hypothetical protein [Thiotrichaceae bacterium]
MHGFKQIWALSISFCREAGENPVPQSLVASELNSGDVVNLSHDQFNTIIPPFDIGPESLILIVSANDVLGCFLEICWPMPINILDLGVESRCLRNGLVDDDDCSLSAALAFHNFPDNSIDHPFIHDGKKEVDALTLLFNKLISNNKCIEWQRYLFRGRYLANVAKIERNGTPIDVDKLEVLRRNRETIKEDLIDEFDLEYHIFKNYKFNKSLFAEYLIKNKIPWLKKDCGSLDLRDEAFKMMSYLYPKIAPLSELRRFLLNLEQGSLAIGSDDRNRCSLVPFKSKTGRNQPSSSRHIFGNSVTMRGFIKPSEGYGLAYIDWCQQEFGIAAVLSNDDRMLEAYNSGDPYLAFAKQVGAVPPEATKYSHPNERSIYKDCVLAVLYGMGNKAFASKIGRSPALAGGLLEQFRANYNKFWEWSELLLNHIMSHNNYKTKLGWQININGRNDVNLRSLLNFPMQANAAEILRVACIDTIEKGIKVCSPVHDALLIESPLDRLDSDIAVTQQLMQDASVLVLDGFKLRSDVDVYRWPDRYMDKRGQVMWDKLNGYLSKYIN